jgi:hypothetical protein
MQLGVLGNPASPFSAEPRHARQLCLNNPINGRLHSPPSQLSARLSITRDELLYQTALRQVNACLSSALRVTAFTDSRAVHTAQRQSHRTIGPIDPQCL